MKLIISSDTLPFGEGFAHNKDKVNSLKLLRFEREDIVPVEALEGALAPCKRFKWLYVFLSERIEII